MRRQRTSTTSTLSTVSTSQHQPHRHRHPQHDRHRQHPQHPHHRHDHLSAPAAAYSSSRPRGRGRFLFISPTGSRTIPAIRSSSPICSGGTRTSSPCQRAMWNAPFYWPLHDALALTEHGAGMSLVSSPIQWLGGSPLLAYNCTARAVGVARGLVAASRAGASADGQHRRRVLRRTRFRVCSLSRVAAGAPASARHLVDTARAAGAARVLRRRAAAMAAAVRRLVDVAVADERLLHVLRAGFAAGVDRWFTPWRSSPRKAIAVVCTWVLFSLPLLPVLYEYYTVQRRLGLGRTRSEMQLYSAHGRSFLTTAPLLRFWHGRQAMTRGGLAVSGNRRAVVIAAALRTRSTPSGRPARSALHLLYRCDAADDLDDLRVPRRRLTRLTSLWHAYDWIGWLPGYSGLRVPERFFMLATLCLAIAAGLGDECPRANASPGRHG